MHAKEGLLGCSPPYLHFPVNYRAPLLGFVQERKGEVRRGCSCDCRPYWSNMAMACPAFLRLWLLL